MIEQPTLFKLPDPTFELDYYAVFSGRTGSHGPLCNVLARDKRHALSIARQSGLTITKQGSAYFIGKTGYFAALRAAFNGGRGA